MDAVHAVFTGRTSIFKVVPYVAIETGLPRVVKRSRAHHRGVVTNYLQERTDRNNFAKIHLPVPRFRARCTFPQVLVCDGKAIPVNWAPYAISVGRAACSDPLRAQGLGA